MSYLIPPSMDEADACLPLESPRWFVVRIKPRAEDRALRGLVELLGPQGLRVYLPHESCWRRRGRAPKREVLRPILAGYLFVEATTAQLYGIALVDGVETVLLKGVRPAAVAEFVETVAFCEAMGAFDHTTPSAGAKAFKRGDKVRIIAGLFGGFMGEVEKVKGQKRLGVLLHAMGRLAPGPVDIGFDQAEILPAAKAA